MYKELVLIKNEQNFWDYTFDISKSIYKNISNDDEIVNFIKNEFKGIEESKIIILESEVYIVLDSVTDCVNCGEKK
jgi:hypothetical protein